jgi:hypothetical protein
MRLIRLSETRHFGIPEDIDVSFRAHSATVEFARHGLKFAEIHWRKNDDRERALAATEQETEHARAEYSRLVGWLATYPPVEQIFIFKELPAAGPDSNVALAEDRVKSEADHAAGSEQVFN